MNTNEPAGNSSEALSSGELTTNNSVKRYYKNSAVKAKKFTNSSGYRHRKPSWRNREPDMASSVLDKVFNSPHLKAKLAKYAFVTKWHEIVGAKIAQHAKPLKLYGTILYVEVESPIWAQELGFLKNVILGRLKEISPVNSAVSDIRFIVAGQQRT